MESATAVRLPQAQPAASRPRWYRADNIRYLLLFNVILEHMITQTGCSVNGLMNLVVVWTRMVTMPTFCFISGYFSKKTDKCYQTAIAEFLIPYLIFNGVFVLCFGSGANNFFSPTFLYWYMMCMFFWKLLVKALSQIKFIVPISLAVALLVGIYSDVGEFLSLSRTLVFLPYFMVGYFMSREDIRKIENLNKGLVLAVTLVVMALWGWLNMSYADGSGVLGLFETFSVGGGRERVVLNAHGFDIDFYYNWKPYGVYGFWGATEASQFAVWKGILMRLAGYGVSAVLIVAMFCLVPDRSLPIIRDGGRRTMTPYLLHAYVIINIRYLIEAVPMLDKWYIMLPAAIFMAVFLMWLLGLPAVNDLYNDFVSFIKRILFRSEEKKPA